MANEQETGTSGYAGTGQGAEFLRTFHASPHKGYWGYLLILAFAVLAVGGLIWYRFAAEYRAVMNYWHARQSSIAADRVRMVSTWLEDCRGDAEVLANLPSLRELASRPSSQATGRPSNSLVQGWVSVILDLVVDRGHYSSIHLLSRGGQVLAQSSQGGILDPSVSQFCRTIALTGKVWIDMASSTGGREELTVCTPVFSQGATRSNPPGSPVGVVVLLVDPARSLFPMLTEEPVPTRTGETVLIREEGNEAAFISPLRFAPAGVEPTRRPLENPTFAAARAALAGRETFGEFTDYRGVRVLASMRRIPLTGWELVRKIDRAEALDDLYKTAQLEVLLAVLFLLALGVLLAMRWRVVLARVLKEEERTFRGLLESFPDAALISSPEGRILLANAWAERMLGYTLEELLGQRIAIVVPERDREGLSRRYDEYLNNPAARQATHRTEIVYRRKDGSEFPAEVSLNLIATTTGVVVCSSVRDITERRRAQVRLATQARIAEIFLTVPDDQMYNEVLKVVLEVMQSEHGVFGYIDRDGALVVPSMTRHFWDKGQVADKVFAFPRDTWRDCSWTQAIREKRPIYSNELSTKALESPIVVRRLVSLPILFQGEVIGLFQVSNKKTDYTETDVRTLQCMSEDVAPILNARLQRGWAEKTLRESEERFRSLVLTTSQIVWSTDTQGKVTEASPHWQEYTGQTTEEILEGGWAKVLHPDDVEHVARAWSRAIEQKTFLVVEYRVRGRDGTYRHFEARGAPVLNPDGSVREWVEACTDITERKRAEEEVRKLNEQLEQRVAERTAQLQASNQELEAFTYSVSHDLRAPLRHIDGFSKLLSEEHAAALPPEAKEYVSIIRESVLHMGMLIDDLLDLARVGRKQLSMQVTGLNSLVEEVIEDLKQATPSRVIEWRVQTLPFVECDPALMKQAFANLISNAVKFTRPRKPAVIEVGATYQDGRPVVFVRDNGVGFSMKYADKLFGVFQRLHRAEDFEGTGVGLATVQRIIRKHGGRVWAEAELDKGATFYFTLGPSDGSRLENRTDSGGNP